MVGKRGACDLLSMTFDYACFVESMWTAVEKGFVMRECANFLAEGLKAEVNPGSSPSEPEEELAGGYGQLGR